MRNPILACMAACLLMLSVMTSCKKEDISKEPDPSYELSLKQLGDDRALADNEIQDVVNIANEVMETYAVVSPAGRNPLIIVGGCDFDATVTEEGGGYLVTLNFNGSTCSGSKKRSGTVAIAIPSGFQWAAAGASYTITYKDLTITRGAGRTIVGLNGSQVVTNISGGLLRLLTADATPVIHTITSNNMQLRFDNGVTRSWTLSRQHTYTYDGGYVLSVSNIPGMPLEAGVNRFGKSFTTSIMSPLMIKQSCNNRLVGGAIQFSTGYTSNQITFGLNSSGIPQATCTDGALYYKYECTGQDGKVFFSVLGAY